MNSKHINAITIDTDSLDDLLAQRTNNPLAERDLPEMLKRAILSGIPVYAEDKAAKIIRQVILDENQNLKYQ